MTYKEPEYHRADDPPFSFPPKSIAPRIDSNLVEIEGQNGSGKTTLLNCLALALGYLDQEKELKNKQPTLKKKLDALDNNASLEYLFRIHCNEPENIDLKIQRETGQKTKFWLNTRQVASEEITKRFEVIFLTEDDPTKVINSSLGKLRKYFLEMEKNIGALHDGLFKIIQNILEYRKIEGRQKELTTNISAYEQAISEAQNKQEEQKKLLTKLQHKAEVINKLKLHEDEKQIKDTYEKLKKKVSDLEKITDSNISIKLNRENFALQDIEKEIKKANERIRTICTTLTTYNQNINAQKLLDNDYTEFNQLKRSITPEKDKEDIQLKMVEEMITLFNRYQESDLIPIVNLPVSDAKKELYRIKAKAATNRVLNLTDALDNAVKDRKDLVGKKEAANSKIEKLTEKNEDLKRLHELNEQLATAETKYIALQDALKMSRSQLLERQKELNDVDGDITSVEKRIRDIDRDIEVNKKLKADSEKRRELESSNKRPMHEEHEEKINILYEKMIYLKEKTYNWSQILQDPTETKKEFDKIGNNQGFSLKDYEIFVKSIGEYLGNQFEPVAYDYKFHNIQYFDIENSIFTTSEDRKIPIDQLSQGQSKITALTGSFKKMDTIRKKIVLIDEIADLDPENLQKVKNMLKERLHDGSLVLAILVRPTHGPSPNIVEVREW